MPSEYRDYMSIRSGAILVCTLLVARPLMAERIPFEVCAESTTWRRPAPEVQAKIWNMGRYNGVGRDAYFWTHDFIVIDDPLSASIAYDVRNLSGMWTEPPADGRCETEPNSRRNEGEWINLWVLLHHVTQVTHEANTYTITVEPMGKGFQSIFRRRLNPSAYYGFCDG